MKIALTGALLASALVLPPAVTAGKLKDGKRMSAMEKSAAADPLKFLFVALLFCRDRNVKSINFSEFKDVFNALRGMESFKHALNFHLPRQADVAIAKMRDWAKKINKNSDIRDLEKALSKVDATSLSQPRIRHKGQIRPTPFISVSAKSDLGAQVEIMFPSLQLDELDFDDTLHSLMSAKFRV